MFNILSIINPFPVSSPVLPPISRKRDSFGSGSFGASRDGGSRIHKGIDLKSYPGQRVFAPISGDLTPITYNGFHGFVIKNETWEVKVLYLMLPPRKTGKVVRGEWLAKAANIKPTYGDAITNHIHVEVRKNGVIINPKFSMFFV